MNRVVLKAQDLDGFLGQGDHMNLGRMDALYGRAMECFQRLSASATAQDRAHEELSLVAHYNDMGALMKEITRTEPRIQVYSFATPPENHGEASRLIAKLRDIRTERHEFVYYIQRAFELLFNLAYGGARRENKNYLIVKTPVTCPVQNFAVHKIPNVDAQIEDSVMCVMLRGALLPSIIMSKEIQEYSSKAYVTPFALFKIKRDESKDEHDMEYILDLDRSYVDLSQLDGRDLIFADPMNATGGSLVTIVQYLLKQGVKPRSIKCFNVIAALKGALRAVRAIENLTVYTLWMDPALNEAAYIMPGLGDAGDRINGTDTNEQPRDILQLVADYGSTIANLYRSQIRKIEESVLTRR
jgi:uracil phosphoribosyltransferase